MFVSKILTLVIIAKSTTWDDVKQSYGSWWKLNIKILFLNSKLTYTHLTAYTMCISNLAYLKHYPSKTELPIVSPLFQSYTSSNLPHLFLFSNTDIIHNSSLSLYPKSTQLNCKTFWPYLWYVWNLMSPLLPPWSKLQRFLPRLLK